MFYQIFPDRFCEGVENKPMPFPDRLYQADKHAEPFWQPNEVGGHLNEDYFGGDLKGIQMKLPYLRKMGVDYLYLNPIFEAHSNHRYNTADYLNVDPCWVPTRISRPSAPRPGSTASASCWTACSATPAPTAAISTARAATARAVPIVTPTPPTAAGTISIPSIRAATAAGGASRPCLKSTKKRHPTSNLSPARGGVIDTWLRRGAAGFRLDVADELPDEFIEKVRTAVKRVGPDKFLLGEVWEDATTKFGFDKRRTYLLGKGLDSVMNYPFKNAVLGFVCGRDAGQTMTDILSICEHYPAPALDTALNFLSTHDTERALTVIADEPANGRGREWQSGRCVTGDAYEEGMLKLRMAYAIIYTLPGVPCLYYGDEIGMQGYRDPFNRGFYCWDSHEERLKPVLAQLAQLRHTCEAFRTGELRVLRAEGGVLHYQRIGEFEAAEIIVNRTEHIIVEPLASGSIPR